MKDAWEPGIADPSRSRVHFLHIVSCFFKKDRIDGARILDLGPGHYDFGHIAAELGATVVGYELDPAVIRLGKLKGFEVIDGDVYDVDKLASLKDSFDGLFCRGSFNSRNFTESEAHRNYLTTLLSVVKEGGFFWVSPCNDPVGDLESDGEFHRIVREQIDFFRENEFQVFEEDRDFINAFWLSSTPPRLLFTKGLEFDVDEIHKELAALAQRPSIIRRIRRKLRRLVR